MCSTCYYWINVCRLNKSDWLKESTNLLARNLIGLNESPTSHQYHGLVRAIKRVYMAVMYDVGLGGEIRSRKNVWDESSVWGVEIMYGGGVK